MSPFAANGVRTTVTTSFQFLRPRGGFLQSRRQGLPPLRGILHSAPALDLRIVMHAAEHPLRDALALAAPAELVVRHRAVHVLDGAPAVHHFQPELRQPVPELDIFRAESELRPEQTSLPEKRGLAR